MTTHSNKVPSMQGLSNDQAQSNHPILKDPISGLSFYRHSIHKIDAHSMVAMIHGENKKQLFVMSDSNSGFFSHFEGERIGDSGNFAKICPLNDVNACILREIFPWTKPTPLKNLGYSISVGCTDRIPASIPSYLSALREYCVAPTLAQQTATALKATNRSFRDCLNDTTFGVFQNGYSKGFASDADLITSTGTLNAALAAGMTGFTIDLSQEVYSPALLMDSESIKTAFSHLPAQSQQYVNENFVNKVFNLPGLTLKFSPELAMQCAITYWQSIAIIKQQYAILQAAKGNDFDLEIALTGVDLTTPPEHHFFIAKRLIDAQIHFTRFAPRLPGIFHHTGDYTGNPDTLAQAVHNHQIITDFHSSYKLSFHTSPEAFSAFPEIAQETNNQFHIKTRGYDWIASLQFLAAEQPATYRKVFSLATRELEKKLATFCVKIRQESMPDLSQVPDESLPDIQAQPHIRRLTETGFVPFLSQTQFREELNKFLFEHEELFHDRVRDLYLRALRKMDIPTFHASEK